MEFSSDLDNYQPTIDKMDDKGEYGGGDIRRKRYLGGLGCLGCMGIVILLVIGGFVAFYIYVAAHLFTTSPLELESRAISDADKNLLEEKIKSTKKALKGKAPVEISLNLTDQEINYLINQNIRNVVAKVKLNGSEVDFKFSQKIKEKSYFNIHFQGTISLENYRILGSFKKFRLSKIDVPKEMHIPILEWLRDFIELNSSFRDKHIRLKDMKIEDGLAEIVIIALKKKQLSGI